VSRFSFFSASTLLFLFFRPAKLFFLLSRPFFVPCLLWYRNDLPFSRLYILIQARSFFPFAADVAGQGGSAFGNFFFSSLPGVRVEEL